MTEYNDAAAYLPHQTPMVLLERVTDISDERATCQVEVSPQGVLAPFLTPQGELPAWFGVEMIAQTVGVWSGWHRHSGGVPTLGMLLGARGFRCQLTCFPAFALLDVSITLLMRDDKIGSFAGNIAIAGQRVASGRLTTWQPAEDDLQQLMQQGK